MTLMLLYNKLVRCGVQNIYFECGAQKGLEMIGSKIHIMTNSETIFIGDNGSEVRVSFSNRSLITIPFQYTQFSVDINAILTELKKHGCTIYGG
jgi:hypothetical protein